MDSRDYSNEMGDVTENLNTIIYKEREMEEGEVTNAPIVAEKKPVKEAFSIRKPVKKRKKVNTR